MPRDVNRPEQRRRRSELRAEMTAPEALLWSRLRAGQLGNLKFRRQYGLGPFIVDFYCPRCRLAIEVDGESHYESEAAEAYDRQRTAYLRGQGVTCVRFTNHDVATSIEAVLTAILERAEALAAKGGHWWKDPPPEGGWDRTSPQSPPCKEGKPDEGGWDRTSPQSPPCKEGKPDEGGRDRTSP